MQSSATRLGVDIGGTFTDVACTVDGELRHAFKVPSTPGNPAEAVLSALVELRARAPRFTMDIEERPWINPLIRQQADQAAWATSLRHEILPLNDLDRHLMRCLDGTNTVSDLVVRFAELVRDGQLVVEHDGQDSRQIADNRDLLETLVTHGLNRLARHAFLQHQT